MRRLWILIGLLLSVTMTACTSVEATSIRDSDDDMEPTESSAVEAADEGGIVLASLPNLGPAPELENEVWLNVDEPLRLENLRGKVVLLEMWTFGCINCIHVIPYVREWHYAYKDLGLVVIGNHYPEFQHERQLDNLQEAIVRLDVPYAVAQDNDGKTWRAYHNRYWPALYLIDKRGDIRYTHFGEGRYTEIEQAIRDLLAETYP